MNGVLRTFGSILHFAASAQSEHPGVLHSCELKQRGDSDNNFMVRGGPTTCEKSFI